MCKETKVEGIKSQSCVDPSRPRHPVVAISFLPFLDTLYDMYHEHLDINMTR